MVSSLQDFFRKLDSFWSQEGASLIQTYDLEKGAGTFNPETFLRSLGPEPHRAAYVESCRRPSDGRYGMNPNRVQHYFQYQVILKPSPLNIQDLCLKSLETVGFHLEEHDIRFVHDDWESPTLGAWGLGWEVWMDGMEVLQFTYFQSCGTLPLHPILGEVTYGTERLLMALLKKESIFEIPYSPHLTYGDLFLQGEKEWSRYNFELADVSFWHHHFEEIEKEAKRTIQAGIPLVAYDFVIKASHAFNLLDARGAISVTERTGYIARIRDLAKAVAEAYLASREKQKFPLLPIITNKKPKREALQTPKISQEKEDFLLEIGSEELPASFVEIAMEGLKKGFSRFLEENQIACDAVELFGTPRRTALLARGLRSTTEEAILEKRGPKIALAFDAQGEPTSIGVGFFDSFGLKKEPLSEIRKGKNPDLQLIVHKNEEYLFLRQTKPKEMTAALLQKALPEIILGIDFPKKMRWSDLEIEYARPLRWIVALFGREPIPFILGDLIAGNESQGHRQRDKRSFVVGHASQYLDLLRDHFVMVSVEARRKTIEDAIFRFEEKHGFKVLYKEKVLRSVVHLAEWPEVAMAAFDPSFLQVPKEILISEMVEHQKYFPIANTKGDLLPSFLITADNVPTSIVLKGNERVLSARLNDGLFLFEQDCAVTLEDFNDRLSRVIFQKDLGTVLEKSSRLQQRVQEVQKCLGISSLEWVKIAAKYAKSDLASHAVYEFPELQGTMGRIYAKKAGHPEEVAAAIEEHWWPKGENQPLPTTATGICLSLADKIDNLQSYFKVGLKPSASSDPYGLRRQVIGMIRIVIENKMHLSLSTFFTDEEIITFVVSRFRAYILEKGEGKKEEIEAILPFAKEDLYDGFLRLQALSVLRREKGETYTKLLEIFKRTEGLLEKKSSLSAVNPSLLKEQEEIMLWRILEGREEFISAIRDRNYTKAFSWVAELQPPLSALFDKVKILDENREICANRLALLGELRALISELFDCKKIIGG